MRCEDTWYNDVLRKCRHGCLDTDSYSLLHGFPTSTPGSWDPVRHRTSCPCGDDVKLLPGATDEFYKQSWGTLFLAGHSGRAIVDGLLGEGDAGARECQECAAARRRRQRVLPFGAASDAGLHEEPFASAPAIFIVTSRNTSPYISVPGRLRRRTTESSAG